MTQQSLQQSVRGLGRQLVRLTVTAAVVSLFSVTMTATAQSQSVATTWKHPDGTTHWYQAVVVPGGITWKAASLEAAKAGGYLATITSQSESEAVTELVRRNPNLFLGGDMAATGVGPWLGGRQANSGKEPGGGWHWTQLDKFTFSNWAARQPDNNAKADAIHLAGPGAVDGSWADAPATSKMPGYVIEFSGALAKRTVGIIKRDLKSHGGYVLMCPNSGKTTYLIDAHGRVINSWTSKYTPGQAMYLLPNGNLLRASKAVLKNPPGLGHGGIIEEFDWSGKLVWTYNHFGADFVQHHDLLRLPNGNTLMIVWIKKTKAEAIAAGRDPKRLPDGVLYPDKIVEVQKTGATSGKVVWEWSAWDHLVQDHDKTKNNYGDPAKHPELIDINYSAGIAPNGEQDWLHPNALDYNATLDQIMISVRNHSELWVIDHSTTTKEAASHKGGKSGKGGDLLYRWGNPAAYRAGTAKDRQLFTQHNTHWIPKGLPGAGNILIFNNGENGSRPYSTIDEIVPPKVDSKGNYARPNKAFGPTKPVWTYKAKNPTEFYSQFVSGVQRLPSGNTLIGAGWIGRTFEVTPKGETVWEYRNPAYVGFRAKQGDVFVAPRVSHFRSPQYAPDYAAFKGRTLTPKGPIEQHAAALLADGSTAPRQINPGTSVDLTLRAGHLPGNTYVAISSVTKTYTAVDNRWVGLGWDSLAQSSFFGALPKVFIGYTGKLDSKGQATAKLVVPSDTPLVGQTIYTVFLVFGPGPNGVAMISNTVDVEILKK